MLELSDLDGDSSRCYSGFSGLGLSLEEVLARIEQGLDVARQEVASQRYDTPVVALPSSRYQTYGEPGGGYVPTWVLIGGGVLLFVLLTRK